MKTKILPVLLFACFVFFPAFAQEKGVKPLPAPTAGEGHGAGRHASRAVVVGISDYQDPGIPDLRFADKDAEAFALFLRSPAGGSLDKNHLRVLTNGQATGAQVAIALDWLVDQSREGDQCIIYFSGHGDVEGKLLGQPGFLLCWDAPNRVYIAGGTLQVSMLQTIVSTLSLENKAQVLLITDACHAGNLAGSQIGGPQITGASLNKQFANEIKILSCQPNEYSLESEQWGGGRGVFSYHLIDGLYGFADKDADAAVSLSEIDRYLEDHVVAETAPQSQIPIVLGNKTRRLSIVDSALLKHLQQYKLGEISQFSPTEGRGLEEEILARVDSSVREIYEQFKLALQEKRFLEPAGNCAEDFYQQLVATAALAPLRNFMKRNYAAALQDDAQQIVNAILKINIQEVTKSTVQRAQQYRDFPKLLARAAELLGKGHYMYSNLKARQLLFEGLLLYFDTFSSRSPESGLMVLNKYRQSLVLQPEMPITYYYMSACFALKMNEPDSAYVYARSALQLAETWLLPYAHLAYFFCRYYQRYDQAAELLNQAMAIDSNSAVVWMGFGALAYYQDQYPEAIRCYQTVLRLDSANTNARANISVAMMETKRYAEAEAMLIQTMRLNPQQIFSRYLLGCLYNRTDRKKEAEGLFLEVLQLNSSHFAARDSLARLYIFQNRLGEAEAQYLEIVKINPLRADVWYNLACFSASDGRSEQAITFLENAIEKGINDLDQIQNDHWFDPIRSLNSFKDLLKKKFPERFKK